ncbi:MAG: branched-chain amino acid ABC transporter permease [Propionibacteriaceae bacterium]|jgi:branched-chain amino acid transport system permease protein|nr:branched-chain amino acid ABC transporter permease [Propionibacteriaceae bacterium]
MTEKLLARAGAVRVAGVVAAALGLVTVLLPWAYGKTALDNMTYFFGPSFLQLCYAILLLVALVALAAKWFRGRLGRFAKAVAWADTAKAAGLGAAGYALACLVAIAVQNGGLVMIEPGGWAAFGLALVTGGAALVLPGSAKPTLGKLKSPPWVQILAIAAAMAVVLFAAAYELNRADIEDFLVFGCFAVAVVVVGRAAGLFGWLSLAAANNRRVLSLAAFAVAFAFPFTQNGSDANMSVANQVLIFAATAMGLNIVVGLVGLLDMGYIAFLGAGAFTAAVLSKSAFATLSVDLPFPVTVLISGVVASLLGLLIGTPTLRVSGDYLAIVTLAFGEIFRITMNNLDGVDGPNITNGSNGVPAIPNLDFFGFNLGQVHHFLGVDLGRQSNYYWLLLVVIAVVIVVFSNLAHSRIGRGWVAIREDELAAEAMGVNTFALKLLAFAGGAFLAGMAGSVKAYRDTAVSPDQFVFLESAFLLAAVVLGGMGTIGGVLIGATLLKLLPEKLRFFEDYRLLLFGALMVLMMRFRPEGIVADERRQLEFHDADEELAEEVEEDLVSHHSLLNPETDRGAVA